LLDQASEIVFSGDAGDTSASRASRRYGVEWTNVYRPKPWLELDADLALTHARFVGYDTDQAALYNRSRAIRRRQIGNAPGNYIPMRRRWLRRRASRSAKRPAGSARCAGAIWPPARSPKTMSSARSRSACSTARGYRTDNGWRIALDVLNLFNTRTNQISYAYGSLIKTDSLYNLCYPVQVAPAAVCQNGVMDSVVHPVEPLAVRLTVAAASRVARLKPRGAARARRPHGRRDPQRYRPRARFRWVQLLAFCVRSCWRPYKTRA